MAKFIYRMQNILDIKYKLEETAKNEYAEARYRLDVEEEKLEALNKRKEQYYQDYKNALTGALDLLNIEELKAAVDNIKQQIVLQEQAVRKRSKELEQARIKLNKEMQERKMHETLSEKQFEEFKAELLAEELKETDAVVAYQYGQKDKDVEE